MIIFIARQRAQHAERDIDLPVLSICLSHADCTYRQTFSTIWYGYHSSFPTLHEVTKI